MHQLGLSFAFGALLVSVTGCGSTKPLLSKSIIEPDTVKAAIATAKELDARSESDPPEGVSWLRVVDGRVPIIVTAPHATSPMRDGKRRYSDGGGTAALALGLSELSHVWVIYTTYASPSDPNYYDDNEFKSTLKTLIERVRPVLLLDIHGSNPRRPYDVDFGTMDGSSLLGRNELFDQLVDRLRSEGIDNLSLNRFAASENATITKFASRLGVPSIQLEVNAVLVTPQSGPVQEQAYARLTQALVRYLTQVLVPVCKERDCGDDTAEKQSAADGGNGVR